jgi:hypothetical protein
MPSIRELAQAFLFEIHLVRFLKIAQLTADLVTAKDLV